MYIRLVGCMLAIDVVDSFLHRKEIMKFKLIEFKYEKEKRLEEVPIWEHHSRPINYVTVESEVGIKYTYVVWEQDRPNQDVRVYLNGPKIEFDMEICPILKKLKATEKEFNIEAEQAIMHFYRQFLNIKNIDSTGGRYKMEQTISRT